MSRPPGTGHGCEIRGRLKFYQLGRNVLGNPGNDVGHATQDSASSVRLPGLVPPATALASLIFFSNLALPEGQLLRCRRHRPAGPSRTCGPPRHPRILGPPQQLHHLATHELRFLAPSSAGSSSPVFLESVWNSDFRPVQGHMPHASPVPPHLAQRQFYLQEQIAQRFQVVLAEVERSRCGSPACCWPPAPGRRCPRATSGRFFATKPPQFAVAVELIHL